MDYFRLYYFMKNYYENITRGDLQHNVSRWLKKLEKDFGICVKKIGRGKKAFFYIEKDDLTLKKNYLASPVNSPIPLNFEMLGETPLALRIFLGVFCLTSSVYRHYENIFLEYIGVDATPANIELLYQVLDRMKENEIIDYKRDDTAVKKGKEDTPYLVVWFVRIAEVAFEAKIDIFRQSKLLGKDNGVRDYINLAKVWVTISALAMDGEAFNQQTVADITGLGVCTIRKYSKILYDNNVFEKEVIRKKLDSGWWNGGTVYILNADEFVNVIE